MELLFAKNRLRVAVMGRNLDDLYPLLSEWPVELTDENPELVISYGGDGSLLGAERRFPGVPKCPLRDARQNPKCPLHAERTILEALFAGKLHATMLGRLKACLEDGTELAGINDVVISRTNICSAIRYRLWLDNELFRGQIVSDSLVIATPFGSTGYFQSITHGNFQAGVGLAFNNAMDLYTHTVVADSTNVKIQLLRGPAVMVADNDPTVCRLEKDAIIHVVLQRDFTPVYGIEAFRCQDCYNLRRNGI